MLVQTKLEPRKFFERHEELNFGVCKGQHCGGRGHRSPRRLIWVRVAPSKAQILWSFFTSRIKRILFDFTRIAIRSMPLQSSTKYTCSARNSTRLCCSHLLRAFSRQILFDIDSNRGSALSSFSSILPHLLDFGKLALEATVAEKDKALQWHLLQLFAERQVCELIVGCHFGV